MNATVQTTHEPAGEWSLTRAAGSSTTEAIGAIAAIVLAIIGLAGLLSSLMASIATIVIGAAILLQGMTVGSFYGSTVNANRFSKFNVGLTTETLGGLAGIVLGILALFGSYSHTLVAVALIVFGVTFLLDSFEDREWQWLSGAELRAESHQPGVLGFGSGGQVLAGLSAVVLGILAVIGLSPLVLTLVGLLALGTVVTFASITRASLMTHFATK